MSLGSRVARASRFVADKMTSLAAPLERRGWIRTMSPELRAAFTSELANAEAAFARGDEDAAMHHYGRGHMLGSYFCFSHLLSHAGMLRVGLRRGDWREVRVQGLRALGTIGTRALVPFFGVTGNPGSADRPIGSRYELPPDVAALLARQSLPVWGPAKRAPSPMFGVDAGVGG
jgi:hypothetical protein